MDLKGHYKKVLHVIVYTQYGDLDDDLNEQQVDEMVTGGGGGARSTE